jgi:peptidoglycan/LPS O-acetylase OafA/YrhL
MTEKISLNNQKKIEELESIRGLAALLIVFHHIPKWNQILDIGIINNAALMVELFFVLSGFVMFNSYIDKIVEKKDLIRFCFLRFGRLYPVHIIFLFVYVLIELTKYIAQIKFGIVSMNGVPFKENNIYAFFKNILLIQSVLPNQPLTFNGPSWSISVEFYTYLIFGLITLYFKNTKIILFSLIATISLVMLATKFTFGFDPMLRCLAGFFIGILTGSVMKNVKLLLPKQFSFLVFTLIILFIQLKSTKDSGLIIYILTALLIASLLISPKSLFSRFLKLKAFTWLGTVSYSLYMSHSAIIWLINQVLRVVLKRPDIVNAIGVSTTQLSVFETLAACSVIIVSVLIVSAIIYEFIEKPLRERSRRFAFSRIN